MKIREDTRAWAEPMVASIYIVFEPYDIAKAKRFYGESDIILFCEEAEHDRSHELYNVPPNTTLIDEMANLVHREIANEATLYDGDYFIDVEINDSALIYALQKKLEKRE